MNHNPGNGSAAAPTPAAPAGPRPVAVLGAGLSGLSTAWHLMRAGIPVVVFEAALRSGGAIGGTRQGEWFHEGGPNSLFETSPEIGRFIDNLGLRPRALYAPKTADKRYIVRDGQPVAMPSSPIDFIANPLLSWRGKVGVLGEPFRRKASAETEESVGDFVTRRLGSEFLDYVVNPFVSGVYAGDPRRLSVRHAFPKLHALEQEHGSLIRGAIKRRNSKGGPKGRMLSFPDGLEEIPRAIAQHLGASLRLGCEVLGIQRIMDRFVIQYARGSLHWHESFSAVVSTLPADVLARIHLQDIPESDGLKALSELDQPPVISVFTGHLRRDVSHPLDGFGMLVPQVEQRQILGTLFSSTLFPGRAPEGHVALTTFLGGMRQPKVAQLSDDALITLVHDELRTLLGVKARAVYVHLQRWARAIPQYNLGFERLKNAYAAVEAGSPGFFIGGNCRDGISLSNCIEGGRRTAERVRSGLLVTNQR